MSVVAALVGCGGKPVSPEGDGQGPGDSTHVIVTVVDATSGARVERYWLSVSTDRNLSATHVHDLDGFWCFSSSYQLRNSYRETGGVLFVRHPEFVDQLVRFEPGRHRVIVALHPSPSINVIVDHDGSTPLQIWPMEFARWRYNTGWAMRPGPYDPTTRRTIQLGVPCKVPDIDAATLDLYLVDRDAACVLDLVYEQQATATAVQMSPNLARYNVSVTSDQADAVCVFDKRGVLINRASIGVSAPAAPIALPRRGQGYYAVSLAIDGDATLQTTFVAGRVTCAERIEGAVGPAGHTRVAVECAVDAQPTSSPIVLEIETSLPNLLLRDALQPDADGLFRLPEYAILYVTRYTIVAGPLERIPGYLDRIAGVIRASYRR